MGIKINNLIKRFGAVTVVNDISVEIQDGEFFTLLGSSGCGKTTTLRMIAGLETPTSGQVLINGKDVTYAEPRERDIAMAFQDYGLYPNMTVYENIEFPLKVRKVAEAERRRKIEETAGTLGIADYLGRKPAQMSGGQRQRVSLARALVRNPKVFLMDEPLSNLDAKLRAVMRTEIRRLVTEQGITTVYVTHDQIEAMSMADRIAVMYKGDMVQVAPPLEIYDRPATHFVADFIGSPPMNLFSAELANNGRVVCEVAEFGNSLTDDERSKAGSIVDRHGKFHVGVRPEHLQIVAAGTSGSAEGFVELVEPLGQTTNIYLLSGDKRFVAVTDRTTVQTGDTIGVMAPKEYTRAVALDR